MSVKVKRLIYPASVGSGSSTAKYIRTFVVGDWTLSGSDYFITISENTHGIGTDPTVVAYFDNGTTFEEVEVDVSINDAGDVTIKVTSTPDNRFDGKITII
jgi:hypothetical protein